MGVRKIIYYLFHPNEVKAMIQWFVVFRDAPYVTPL